MALEPWLTRDPQSTYEMGEECFAFHSSSAWSPRHCSRANSGKRPSFFWRNKVYPNDPLRIWRRHCSTSLKPYLSLAPTDLE